MPRTYPEPQHGTRWRYQVHKCRCAACRAAEAMMRSRARQHARLRAGATEHCLLCDWVGFNISIHELKAHPRATGA